MFSSNQSQVFSAANWIEECFSTYLYTGDGSTQTITNGIDLSGKGGMVWIKQRNGTRWNVVTDTVRGINSTLFTNDSRAIEAYDHVTAFNANGFGVKDVEVNGSGSTYASWTFREQAKFFDVVTYTGNGSNRTIAHSLGSVPGCIIIKRTDAAADWQVYHRSLANTEYVVLNTTAAKATGTTRWNSTTPTSTEFSLGTDSTVNANSGTYVAYLFAHDAGGFGATGSDNVISCGSFTTDGGSSFTAVNLGYEPQWLLIKGSSGTSNWTIVDNMRGIPVGSNGARLIPNLSDAETSTFSWANLTATGFGPPTGGSNPYAASTTYIYIAIRRGPMKTPTSGTSVYNGITRTGTGAATTVTGVGFAPDLVTSINRDHVANTWNAILDRMRGIKTSLTTNETSAETASVNSVNEFGNDGINIGTHGSINSNTYSYINHFFRRAPGFFDVVCYTGTGSTRTVTHNLTVAPELMIIKVRGSITDSWQVYCSALDVSGGEYLLLNDTAAKQTNGSTRFTAAPTSTEINLATNGSVNGSGNTYVAYLFASVTGVSKIGGYTGNGSNQTINCGFTAGARFVMIKRTSSTGDWYVWDTARGIVSGNDPRLSLNSTAAEVTTDDSIDPDNSGFIVNQLSATNINVSSATYIYLAIA